jgi:hypothetical protein
MENFSIIAPCGMNCSLCLAYQREKNHCPGCNSPEAKKQKHCENCSIKNCIELKGKKEKFCYTCEKFPCTRLKQLDKRYRTRYGTSFIENLQKLKENGTDKYLEMEKDKWTCNKCKSILCIHREKCPNCNNLNKEFPVN